MDRYWTTREGVTMKIAEMTDNHLCNAIRCLERRLAELYESEGAG